MAEPEIIPQIIPQGTREAGDDFFCLRCDQGRFNLQRHRGALRGVRWRLAPPE